jgi:hypothetical protein
MSGFVLEDEWSELLAMSRTVPVPALLMQKLDSSLLPELLQILSPQAEQSSDDRSLSVERAAKILILCRNCCGQVDAVLPNLLILRAVFRSLLAWCRHIILFEKLDMNSAEQLSENALDAAAKLRIINLIAQVFSNATAASLDACNHLAMEESCHLVDLIAASLSTGHRPCVACVVNVVYNCMCSAKVGNEERFHSLLSDRLIFCQLFLAIYQQQLQPDQSLKTVEEDPVGEWLSLLVADVCSQGLDYVLYGVLGSTQGEIFTLEQVCFSS